MKLLSVGIDELMPDPTQPRKTFVKEELERLSASIKASGVLQPLRVQWDEQRQVYQILTGESRWRAARMADQTHVPCIVVGELSEIDKLADRLTENGVRHDLEPIEEAAAMGRLKTLKRCTSKTLVEEYGFSGAAITRMESLLRLPPTVQAMVGTGPGKVPPSAAYSISRLDDPEVQLELAEAVAGKRLSRDGVVQAVQDIVGTKVVKPKNSRLSQKLKEGVTVTVSAGRPLTKADLEAAAACLRKAAKKIDGAASDATAELAQAS